jgi:hypothetical protein
LRIEADQRVIVGAGLPVHHYRAEDAVAEAYAMVFLVESGFAQQTDVARAFGRWERTVRRYQERYAQGGMAALGRAEGWRCIYRSRSGAWKCSRAPVRAEAGLPRRRRRASPRVTVRGETVCSVARRHSLTPQQLFT